MRAAVLAEAGGVPQTGEFDEPTGEVLDVLAAGCNPIDLLLASGDRSQPALPSVVGQEGVGVTAAGDRVYFNSPATPYGSWAERCPINDATVIPVPDGLDDATAVSLGIAGLAAWLSLTRHADVTHGESVLILGATGAVGQIAVQAARLLGAGRVVAAGRHPEALERTLALGADTTLIIGGDDDAEILRAEAGEGYQVVIDTVYGKPFLAALEASAIGATLVTVGLGAHDRAEIPFWSLQGRTHVCHGNPFMSTETLRDGYTELATHAAAGRIRVATQRYSLNEAAQAWQQQADGTHTKVVITPRDTN